MAENLNADVGYLYHNAVFIDGGYNGFWWSSTENYSTAAWYTGAWSNFTEMYSGTTALRTMGFLCVACGICNPSSEFPEFQGEICVEIVYQAAAGIDEVEVGRIAIGNSGIEPQEFNQVQFYHNPWFYNEKAIRAE